MSHSLDFPVREIAMAGEGRGGRGEEGERELFHCLCESGSRKGWK